MEAVTAAQGRELFRTSVAKKRAIGVVLFVVVLGLFFSFNRLPKLDIVDEDLEAVSGAEVQCFQGFCLERDPATGFLSRWWSFAVTYLRLVTMGMTFAFLIAGLAEAFLFSQGSVRALRSGGAFGRTVKGLIVGPVMNLCSACIVPVSAAYQRRGGGIEGGVAMVQGSATLNVPSLAMVFLVFTPLIGFSRLILALTSALLIGPIVAATVVRTRSTEDALPKDPDVPVPEEASTWGEALAEGSRDWAKASIGYLVRMGPIMVAAGFISGLAIQWISPGTVSAYLGNDLTGIVIAATFGLLINVPLLFEIPLVALLLLLGMGVAPAATLLFAAAAGGPITFWGFSKVMPLRAIAVFAGATWVLGVIGGLAVLGLAMLV